MKLGVIFAASLIGLSACTTVVRGPQQLYLGAETATSDVSRAQTPIPEQIGIPPEYTWAVSGYKAVTIPNSDFGVVSGRMGGGRGSQVTRREEAEEWLKPVATLAQSFQLRDLLSEMLKPKPITTNQRNVVLVPAAYFVFEDQGTFRVHCQIYAKLSEQGKGLAMATYSLAQDRLLNISDSSLNADVKAEVRDCFADALKLHIAHKANRLGSASRYQVEIYDPVLKQINVEFEMLDEWVSKRLIYQWSTERAGQHLVQMPASRAFSVRRLAQNE